MTRTTTAGYLSRCLFIVAIVLIVREHVDCGRTDEIESTPKPVEGLGTLHIPPLFDLNKSEISQAQRKFLDQSFEKHKPLFKKVLDTALENRGKMAASFRLVANYFHKLFGVIFDVIYGTITTKGIAPSASFYRMLADVIDHSIGNSTDIKNNGTYKSSEIDSEVFKARVIKACATGEQIIKQSPAGFYLQWDKLVLYEEKIPLVKEASELWAQFRVMGYESTVFIARRLINLLRFFGRGKIPKKAEIVM